MLAEMLVEMLAEILAKMLAGTTIERIAEGYAGRASERAMEA